MVSAKTERIVKEFFALILNSPCLLLPSGLCHNFIFKVKSEHVCCSVMSDSVTPWTEEPGGLLEALILEWVAIPFSWGSSWPRNQTQVSCTAGRFFTIWATREAHWRWLANFPSGIFQFHSTWDNWNCLEWPGNPSSRLPAFYPLKILCSLLPFGTRGWLAGH